MRYIFNNKTAILGKNVTEAFMSDFIMKKSHLMKPICDKPEQNSVT